MLVLLPISYDLADVLYEYIEEFYSLGEYPLGMRGIWDYSNMRDWLDSILANQQGVGMLTMATMEIQSRVMVGCFTLRQLTTEGMLDGNCSYAHSIRPCMRGRGYAVEQFKLASDISKGLGWGNIIVAVEDWNTASLRSIAKAGGSRIGMFNGRNLYILP